ncbi:MAG: DUF503 domain-containing protein [Thermoleophilia bacterium]|nr:DUF503 domain-containing protein [Thermoleophilia bacterium]
MIVDAPPLPDNVLFLSTSAVAPTRRREMSGSGFAGLMVLDLHLPQARSLKDKRQPLRSLRARLRDAGFSMSEVDFHDKWQRAQVAVSIVGRRSGDVEDLLDSALRMFESRPDLEVSVRQRTVLAIEEYED